MAIPYSLSLIIVMICTNPDNREKQFNGLKERLIKRLYPEKVIDAAINRARNVPRKVELLNKLYQPKVKALYLLLHMILGSLLWET